MKPSSFLRGMCVVGFLAAVGVVACGDDDPTPTGPTGGSAGKAGASGSGGRAGASGSGSGAAGQSGGANGGAGSGTAGNGEAGSGTAGNDAGSGGDSGTGGTGGNTGGTGGNTNGTGGTGGNTGGTGGNTGGTGGTTGGTGGTGGGTGGVGGTGGGTGGIGGTGGFAGTGGGTGGVSGTGGAGGGGGSNKVVINEIVFNSSPGADVGSFIELKGPPGTSLAGYTIRPINGNGGMPYGVVTLEGNATIGTNGYFVLAQDATVTVPAGAVLLVNVLADLQNGPDSVLLLDPTGATIDALGYSDGLGKFDPPNVNQGEGPFAIQPAGPNANDSLARLPDGSDTNNNSVDFDFGQKTPGAPNLPSTVVGTAGPDGGLARRDPCERAGPGGRLARRGSSRPEQTRSARQGRAGLGQRSARRSRACARSPWYGGMLRFFAAA
ncbi:MAG TPA: lamin tail domain-containing protein, partial [Polyangiaceae bacterium]|nr:lamin tail domain-containing protein [Polyangiaceae bacterium]